VVTPAIRALLQFEIVRTRSLYAVAQPGVAVLDPTSRDCVQTAITLYGGILSEVERVDYQVLTQRVRVPRTQRARVALPALVRARRARRAVHLV
jgi:phytoene synthase